MQITTLLLALLSIFIAAKVFGEIAERVGQPAVLGEMVGGVVIGVSGLHLIDPHAEVLRLFAEIGIILLLFLIGLETDIRRLINVGGAAVSVAVVGVVVPLILGFGVGYLLGFPPMIALFLGSALTATSVGITARVLSDLGQLSSNESQVILGAAVVDDILGLVLLSIVSAIAAGREMTPAMLAKTSLTPIVFVIVAIAVGSILAPRLIRLVRFVRVAKALFFASITFAFALAYLANLFGSALIIGAFAAGLVLARTDRRREIEHEVHDVAQFFIPVFFVLVGAAVDLKAVKGQFLLVAILLTLAAIAGKLVAGLAAFPRSLRKLVIGVGMVPRGEVGLIFAQLGLSAGLLSAGLYSSVALMVLLTTFVTPPALRALFAKTAVAPEECDNIVADIVSDAMSDDAPL